MGDVFPRRFLSKLLSRDSASATLAELSEKEGAFKEATSIWQHMASLASPSFLSAPHADITASAHTPKHTHSAGISHNSVCDRLRGGGGLRLTQERTGDLGNE